mgnify:CR=1 FL=1
MDMNQPRTIRGLDDALADLERAIESLPDGGTKRQLLKKYHRLSDVRRSFGHDEPHSRNASLGSILILLGIIVALIFFLLLRSRIAHSDCRQ